MNKKEDVAREECKRFLCSDLEEELGEKISEEKLESAWEERYEELFNGFYSEKVSPWRIYIALRNEAHFL